MWPFDMIPWKKRRPNRGTKNENNPGSLTKRQKLKNALSKEPRERKDGGQSNLGAAGWYVLVKPGHTSSTIYCSGVIESLINSRSSSSQDPRSRVDDPHGVCKSPTTAPSTSFRGDKKNQSIPVTLQSNGHLRALPGAATISGTSSERKKENLSHGSLGELGEETQQSEKLVVTASGSLHVPKKRRRAAEEEADGRGLEGRARERELEKKLNQYSDRFNAQQQEFQTLERNMGFLEQENQNLREQISKNKQTIHKTESGLKALQQQILELEKNLKTKNQQIATFTKDIARLSNEQPDSSRDDHYFETELSVLFRSIQSWVLGCYRNLEVPADFSDASIPSRMHDQLSQRLGDGYFSLMQNNALEILQTYIISEMRESIFTSLPFGIVEGYQNLLSIVESLAGIFILRFRSVVTVSLTCSTAPEEAIKWRISTVNLIMRQNDFQDVISTKAQNLVNQIVETLQALVGNIQGVSNQPVPAARTRKLKALIEKAAKLAVEFQKEPSVFTFKDFDSGTPCIGSQMSDAQCRREDKEMEDSGSQVIITVCPTVVRRAYEIEEEVVIVKAKVLASMPLLEEAVAVAVS